jgi:hypothetical protein
MRLTTEEKNNIVKYAKQYFGEEIRLYLFGSRADDSKKGGDIDLYLETSKSVDMQTQVNFLKKIYTRVTQRKVDLLIKTPFGEDKSIFHTAKKEGILLC